MIKENKRKTGAKYERAAAEYLRNQGYEILEYNYRCHGGEIDLVVRDGEYLVFCEVKYRSDTLAGHSLEAVDKKKQHTIVRCAQFYLMEHGMDDCPVRFDVIGITGNDICLIKDAFESA